MHEPQTRYKLLEVLGRIYDALLFFFDSINLYGGTATNFNTRSYICAQFVLEYDCVKSVIWSQPLETSPCRKQGLLDKMYVVAQLQILIQRSHICAQFVLEYDCVKSVIWSQPLQTSPCGKHGLLDTTYVSVRRSV